MFTSWRHSLTLKSPLLARIMVLSTAEILVGGTCRRVLIRISSNSNLTSSLIWSRYAVPIHVQIILLDRNIGYFVFARMVIAHCALRTNSAPKLSSNALNTRLN